MSMSDSLAPIPGGRRSPSWTQEAHAQFRARIAEQAAPAAPQQAAHPDMVVMHTDDGGVVVFTPNDKLVILAAERLKRGE